MNQSTAVDETTDLERLFFEYLTGQMGNEQGYHSYPGFLEILDLYRDLSPGPVRDKLEGAILAMLIPDYHHPSARGLPLICYG